MTKEEANQIADMLNNRNELAVHYDGSMVLAHENTYEYETNAGLVVACVQLCPVQWYQTEVRHLSVLKNLEGTGVASALYQRVETVAQRDGARLLQCTIRVGNEKSESFFRKKGFTRTAVFANADTGHDVGVWQKVLAVGS